MSKVKSYPSQEYLKLRFDYRDGSLFFKKRTSGVRANLKAGHLSASTGRIVTVIDGKHFFVHRLIWIHHNGTNPTEDIDHIDRNKTNNRIENLRVITRSQNLHNAVARRGNVGGCVGVNWVESRQCWRVSLCINYNQTRLGQYKDYFEACCARKSAENKADIFKPAA